MAAGWYEAVRQGSIYFALIDEWNGTSWSIVPSPSPYHLGGGAILRSISCTSASRCTAVGETLVFETSDGGLVPHPLVESWDGTAWTIVPTPRNPNSGAILKGVSCSSPSMCIAVGSVGRPRSPTDSTLAEEWNGVSWRVVSTPPANPGGTALLGVSSPSTRSCTAVGYDAYDNSFGTSLTLAEMWNGTRWRRFPAPAPGGSGVLGGISCASRSVCVSVGQHDVSSGNLIRATLGRCGTAGDGPSPRRRTLP